MFVSAIYDQLHDPMLHRYLLLICITCVATITAIAQPDLGVKTLPTGFKSYWMRVCDTTGVGRGSAGTEMVWSYTNLVLRGNDSTTTLVTDRSALTPELQQRFPNAEFIVIDDTTTYFYQILPSGLRLDGRVTPGSSLVASPDPYDVRPSEVVFNDPKFDTYNGAFESSTLPPGPKPVTGSHSFTYDGFGRLLLPDFTYNNVARITQRDTSTTAFTIGPQRAFLRITSHTTTWQQLNTSIPLLQVEESVFAVVDSTGRPIRPGSLQKRVRYLDRDSPTSVVDDSEDMVAVAPTPTSADHVSVLGRDIATSTVVVINTLGESVPCSVTSIDGGFTVDISQLACGSYSVLLISEQPGGVRVRTASFIRQ